MHNGACDIGIDPPCCIKIELRQGQGWTLQDWVPCACPNVGLLADAHVAEHELFPQVMFILVHE